MNRSPAGRGSLLHHWVGRISLR